MKQCPSKYFEPRKAEIDMLVLHSTALPNAEAALQSYDDAEVSAHYLIDYSGEIIQCVDENFRAYHAGQSYWRGIESDINSHSIGIEIVNPTLGQSPFEEAQIAATIKLCREIIERYNIKQTHVVGHSDIAPLRKPDPGVCFPWQRLAENGIGLWYGMDDSRKLDEKDVAKLLSIIGYDVRTPEVVLASGYAFCRRYVPQIVRVVEDIHELLHNVLPSASGAVRDDFMREGQLINILQSVAFSYENYR